MICLDGEKCFAQSFCFGGGKWSTGCLWVACCKVISMSAGKDNCVKFIPCVPRSMQNRLGWTRGLWLALEPGWWVPSGDAFSWGRCSLPAGSRAAPQCAVGPAPLTPGRSSFRVVRTCGFGGKWKFHPCCWYEVHQCLFFTDCSGLRRPWVY